MAEFLYLDCSSGVSGDMLLGALLEVGLSLADLNRDLATLKLAKLRVRKQTVMRAGVRATWARVVVPEAPQPHRGLHELHRRIQRTTLPPLVKRQAQAVFSALAESEARIHGTTVEKIHFHEVGALDALADVVGVVAGMARLGFTAIYCSPINVGGGWVESQHGLLAVPAPATLNLLQGFHVTRRGPQAELATPTGAALLRVLAQPLEVLPSGKLVRSGYGAGARDFPGFSNCLRAWVMSQAGSDWDEETLAVLATNVDDATPQVCAYTLERLMAAGALDALFKPVHMKKNRPAQQLEVLCRPEQARALAEVLFQELPTLGVRFSLVQRWRLPRTMETLRLHGQTVRIKRGKGMDGLETLIPEYDDAKNCALHTGLPLRQILEEACTHARRHHERKR